MKNSTLLLAFFLIIALSPQLKAQELNFIVGYNSSSLALQGDSVQTDGIKSRPGFHIGASVNIKINDYLDFQPGLTFQSKGVESEVSFFGISQKSSISLYYLDIPLNLVGKYDINKQLSAYLSAGPYVGIGLSGEVDFEVNAFGNVESGSDPVEWGNDFQRLDFGLGLGAGVNYQNFILGFSYDLGLANILVDPNPDESVKNNVFRISVGYTINLWF